MKILMTLPFPGVKGPLNEHIPLLIEELENSSIKIEKFYYGRRRQEIFFLVRIIHMLGSLIDFSRIILFKKITIVQLNTSFDKAALLRDVLFVSIARIARKKVFIKMHGSFYNLLFTKNTFWYFYSCLLFKLADQVGVLSLREKEEFSFAFRLFKNKFIVVKNPIDIEFLKGSNHRRPWKDKTFHILYASRIIKEKGVFDLINAIPSVIQHTNAHFIFAGSGKDETEALSLIKKLNLFDSGHLTWLGDVPSQEMKDLFSSVDLFVFPTHFPEGMPMALVNAMALGLPIITTKVRFTYDYFKEPDNCLFVEHNNSLQLAEKTIYLFNHPEIRKRMSENNQRLEKEFDKKIVSQEYIQLYTELFGLRTISERKKRILFIVPLPPPYAGPEVASKTLIDSSIKETFDLIPLCCNVHMKNKDKGKINFSSTMRFIFVNLQILLVFIFKRPDATYTLLSQNFTGFIRDSFIISIAKAFHKKVILHFHGSNFKSFYNDQSESFKSFIASTLKKADAIIIQAHWLKEFFSQFIPEDKIKVIYNPINSSQFIIKPEINNRLDEKSIKVLYLSNISAAKGFLILAESMRKIIQERRDIKFIIAGSIINKERNIFFGEDGKKIFTQDINRTISEIKNNSLLNRNVFFLNEITNLEHKRQILNQSDIFVLPSYSEGCPMAVLEAMSAGLPVIVTPVGALPEIIQDSKNGFFVKLNDPNDLKNKIMLLANDYSLRNEIGRQNRALIRDKFEVDIVIPQFNCFLQEFFNNMHNDYRNSNTKRLELCAE